jgi:arsenate reductase (thioredoxin)
MSLKNVLFLCTGNSARSQMGEAFLRKYAADKFYVYSAGLEPKGINPLTIKVMDEAGIDIRQQSSDGVKDYMGKIAFRYVIVVCAEADENCPAALWHRGEKLFWPFDDPAKAVGDEEEQIAVFRRVRDQIEARVKAWVTELKIEEAL